jgi:hypothetical protein
MSDRSARHYAPEDYTSARPAKYYANAETTRLNRGGSITLAPEDCTSDRLTKHYAIAETTRLNRGRSITLVPEDCSW